MIGCPIRNRAWILPRYLESLQRLEYPGQGVEYCFIINDCCDETPQILEQFAQRETGRVKLIYQNYGTTHGHLRGSYNLTHLAALRNRLIQAFLNSECAFLFSVDSDILVPPETLRRLIDDNCDIVSTLVCNGHELGDESIYNVLVRSQNGYYVHLRDFPRDRVFRVDCTGAAYLISRRVLENFAIRYSSKRGAEDIGFCHAAAEKGLKIYCDGRLECTHAMREENVNA